jgi:CRISPR system Cascade subunit CasB
MTTLAQNLPAGPSLASDVAQLSGVIDSPHYSSGDRAALRRWAPGQPIPLAFYRLWLRHLDSDLPVEGQAEAWMTLAWGLATCGAGCHDLKRPLGRALAEAGFSEARLERLLSAPPDLRVDLFMSAARFVAAKAERFDWRDAAQFLLTLDANKREGLNRRIAETYFRHLPQEAKTKE